MAGAIQTVLAALMLFVAVPQTTNRPASPVAQLTVVPEMVKAHTFFTGADLDLSGTVPSCDGVFIKVSGMKGEILLRRKGRVVLFWMTKSEVRASNAPSLFWVISSGEPNLLCSRELLDSLVLDYDGLSKGVVLVDLKSQEPPDFDEFTALQEKRGMYAVLNGTIELRPVEQGEARFQASLHLPPTVQPGSYRVELFAFREGRLIAAAQRPLRIEETGLPLLISSLAFGHPALYGVMAIVAAILSGLAIGALFSRRRSVH